MAGEEFFFKGSLLKGHARFDWRLVPPYPLGSPIARLIHGWYFGMRRVAGVGEASSIPLLGHHARGNFKSIDIPAGEKHFVDARVVVGFSGATNSVHTHIKIAPVYWCLRKHFFTVFEGPATVLLYGPSPIEASEAIDFQPEQVLAFNIQRPFIAALPAPTTQISHVANVFFGQILWRFLEGGETVIENRIYESGDSSRSHRLWRTIGHFLAFFRI